MKRLVLFLLLLLLVACGATDDSVPTEPGRDPDAIAERGDPERLPVYEASGIVLSSVTSQSATAVVYGPVDHVRQKGQPVATADAFSASPGVYTLVVVNGPEGAERSSSAIIRINGEEVVSPDEFSQQVGLITKEIDLKAQNEISVEVRGKPGAVVRLQIEGEQLPFKVGGNVTTADGGPVSNATVLLTFDSGEKYQTLTDSGGLFTFTDFTAEGPFVLEATSSNNLLYGSLTGSVSADLPQVDVTLVAAKRGPGVVTGTVRSSTGEAVADAAVTIIFSATSFTASTSSGPDGYFSLSGLPTDGSFSVTAFDAATVTSGSKISFITPSNPTDELTLNLDPPPVELTTFANGSFADGTLNGWQTEGNVQVVNKGDAFPETVTPAALQLQSSSYAAVASTAGDSRATGRMSQPFLVSSCHTRLQGKLRFLSDEWPDYYGTEYNDAYIVKLVTPSGARVLAQGNLNSSSWSGGLLGYSGKTPVVDVDVDVSAFAGGDSPLTIDIQVSDVGDLIYDSAMAVADFQVVDGDAFNLGSQSLGTLSSGGQVKLSDVTFKAPSVLSYVMPDDFVPAGVSTPYTFEQEDSLIVVTRQSDLQSGSVTFEVPVQAVGSGGEPINFTSDKKVSFLNTESEPTPITNGVARVPVTVPAGSGVQDINLNNIEINAEDGVSTQSADRCDAVVPINFTGELPNQQIGSDVGDDVAGWFGDLGLDWETVGFALKFIYDLIPLVGDGTELISQLVNYLTGKGVDEVAATLSAIGFALDLPTDPATMVAGGVVSSSKSIYKLSKEGAGVLAKVIGDVATGPGTAKEKVEALRDAVGTFVDLFVNGGVTATRNADEVASVIQNTGKTASDSVQTVGDAVDSIKRTNEVDAPEFLETAESTSDIPGFEDVFERAARDNTTNGSNAKGAYNEMKHAKNVRERGQVAQSFPGELTRTVNGKSVVADVDVVTVENGRTFYDDVKSSLGQSQLSDAAKSQAERLRQVAQADGTTARWVIMRTDTLSYNAVNELKQIGLEVVDSVGNPL